MHAPAGPPFEARVPAALPVNERSLSRGITSVCAAVMNLVAQLPFTPCIFAMSLSPGAATKFMLLSDCISKTTLLGQRL